MINLKKTLIKLTGPLCSLAITLMLRTIISLRKLKVLSISIFTFKRFQKKIKAAKKKALE